MFGIKQYKYKLSMEGKAPQVLFKERNLSLKIRLLDRNENLIQNGISFCYLENAVSLHFKVFYSNGK